MAADVGSLKRVFLTPDTHTTLSLKPMGCRWKVSHFVGENNTLIFDPTTGGQGGEGMTSAAQWYVENVKEECDHPGEYFYDEKSEMLYFNFNGTAG